MGTVGGSMLGRYEVIRHLASGGMADLLLARARGLEGFERHVVIKRIRADAEDDQAFIDMFLVEARLAGALHHHNIVQVHDIGEENGKPYFAMEYVHGEDLRRLLALVVQKGEQIPFPVVVTIVTAVARALHHAHEQQGADQQPLGIVHRDVSPANIVVGYDGNVKVLDFGIARAAMRRTETQAGMLKGKAPYMAPEQCTGAAIDRRSDVFGLGIVLYELVTARRLFKSDNDFSTMTMVVNGSFPKPSTIRKDLPPDLERIILRALARDPGSRYQTAEQMFVALEQLALSAEWRTSASALATYLQQLFGTRTEPWLEKAPAPEPVNVDFDGTRPGLAVAPVEATRSAVPTAMPATNTSPMMRARAEAQVSSGVPPVLEVVTSAPIKIPEASGPIKAGAKSGKISAMKPVPATATPARGSHKTVQVPVVKGDNKTLADTQVLPMTKPAKPDADTTQLPTTKNGVNPEGDTEVLTQGAKPQAIENPLTEALFDDTQVVPMTESAALPMISSGIRAEAKSASPAAAKVEPMVAATSEVQATTRPAAIHDVVSSTRVDQKIDLRPAAKVAPTLAANGEAKPAVNGEARPAAKAEAKPAAKPAAKPEAKPAAKADAKPAAKSDAKPAARSDAKPAASLDAKPAAKVDAAPAAKLDVRPPAKEPKFDSRAETKADAKMERASTKVDPKPIAAGVAKLGVQPAAKVELKKLALPASVETESVTHPIIEREETHTDAMAMPPAVSPHAPRSPRSLPTPGIGKPVAKKPVEPASPPMSDRAVTATSEIDPLDAITATESDLDDTVISPPGEQLLSTLSQRSDPTAIVEPLPSPLLTDSPRSRRKSTAPVAATPKLFGDTDQLVSAPRPRWVLPAIGGGVLLLAIVILGIAFSGGDDDLATPPETAKVAAPPKAQPTAAPAASDDVRTEARPRTWANSQSPDENAVPGATPDAAEPTTVTDSAHTAVDPSAVDTSATVTEPPVPGAPDPDLGTTEPAAAVNPVTKPEAVTPAPIVKTPAPAPKPVAVVKTPTPAPKPAAIVKTPKPAPKPAAITKTPK
ncbi:MAG: protein kinase, partial [Deltaproteobacteria bacterium]|nr:protein kinase [Deltaproteobacteria bacterium]